MDLALIAGIAAVVGLVAAGGGLYAMAYAMGFFQYLGGNKRPSMPPVSRQDLIEKLLTLNDPERPYRIARGLESDVVAEWKIVDVQWYGIFNKSGLKEAYRALLLVDEDRHSVRCFEELGTVTWTAGVSGLTPKINYSASFFRGRILHKKEYAKSYGIRQPSPLQAGKVYEYKFDVNEIRGPIIQIVEQNGWEWVPVTARRHATYTQAKSWNRTSTAAGPARASAVAA